MIAFGIILIVLGLIILVVGIIAEACDWRDGRSLILGWFAGALVMLGFWGIVVGKDSHTIPNAMDVYQGKTTLQYIVCDGEVKDSTVVWKNKYEHDK